MELPLRNGREVPHRRHWLALRELANAEDPQRELKEKSEDVEFEEDILPELGELDLKYKEITDAVGLSRSYVSDVLRGEKTPSMEYWKGFAKWPPTIRKSCTRRSGRPVGAGEVSRRRGKRLAGGGGYGRTWTRAPGR